MELVYSIPNGYLFSFPIPTQEPFKNSANSVEFRICVETVPVLCEILLKGQNSEKFATNLLVPFMLPAL